MKRLQQGLDAVLIVLLGAITAITFYQVIGRYVLNSSPSWAEALVLLLLNFIIFLSVPILYLRSEHISFEYFWNLLPNRSHSSVRFLQNLLVAAFSVLTIIYSFGLMRKVWSHTTPTLGISDGINYVPILMSGIALLLIAIWKMVRQWR